VQSGSQLTRERMRARAQRAHLSWQGCQPDLVIQNEIDAEAPSRARQQPLRSRCAPYHVSICNLHFTICNLHFRLRPTAGHVHLHSSSRCRCTTTTATSNRAATADPGVPANRAGAARLKRGQRLSFSRHGYSLPAREIIGSTRMLSANCVLIPSRALQT